MLICSYDNLNDILKRFIFFSLLSYYTIQIIFYNHKLSLMTSHSNCRQAVLLQLQCKCQQESSISNSSQQQYDLQPLYKKFTSTLQNQLQTLQQQNNKEIELLNTQLFQYKNTISRLEARNKRDGESQKQLRRQYNYLLQKYNQLHSHQSSSPEVRVVQKIRQVKVVEQSPALVQQLSRVKQKNDNLNVELHKMKMERDLALVQNDNLKDDIRKLNEGWKLTKLELQEVKKSLKDKDSLIQKLSNQNDYLKNNKEIIRQTKHLFPDFKPAERIRNQPRIQTIYVDKPIQKIKVVQVQRRVKQFIQPERAVVNRLITCAPSNPCKCDDERQSNVKYEAEFKHLNEVVGQLQRNVQDYKSQRQKLVSMIGTKDGQLNHLQAKLKLYGSQGSYRQSGPSQVNVTVTKLHHQQQPTNNKTTVVSNQRQTRVKK